VQTIDFGELSRLSDILDARKPYLELISGRKVRKVSGRMRHSRLQLEFAVRLHDWAADKGVVGIEWRFWLIPAGEERTSLVPDVAYLSNERFNRLEGDAREMPPFAPDIVVEIRSPGDRASNVQRKIELYLAHGSALVIDVDPLTRTIALHDTSTMRVLREGDRFEHAAAPGLTFDVRALFASVE
jgi:Uma2 family endonuclease